MVKKACQLPIFFKNAKKLTYVSVLNKKPPFWEVFIVE